MILAANLSYLSDEFIFDSEFEFSPVLNFPLHVKASWPVLQWLLIIEGCVLYRNLILKHECVVIGINLRRHEPADLMGLIHYRSLCIERLLIFYVCLKSKRFNTFDLQYKWFSPLNDVLGAQMNCYLYILSGIVDLFFCFDVEKVAAKCWVLNFLKSFIQRSLITPLDQGLFKFPFEKFRLHKFLVIDVLIL